MLPNKTKRGEAKKRKASVCCVLCGQPPGDAVSPRVNALLTTVAELYKQIDALRGENSVVYAELALHKWASMGIAEPLVTAVREATEAADKLAERSALVTALREAIEAANELAERAVLADADDSELERAILAYFSAVARTRVTP